MKDVLDGVLNLNKPAGLSSQQAVIRVKKILRARRAGHAGTLDPQATGVLVICLGKATKITSFLMNTTKGYTAQMVLGQETDTQDSLGKVVKSKPVPPLGWAQLEAAFKRFEGEVEQVAPMYSALRVNGERLYKLARKGLEVDREPRRVYIYSLVPEAFSSPVVRFSIICTSGTYVRTVCHDVGRFLGCGAHLAALERTSVGHFKIHEALTLEQLEGLARKGKGRESLLSLDRALSFLPALTVREEYVERVLHGAPVQAGWAMEEEGAFAAGGMVRVKSPDSQLLGIAEAILDSKQISRTDHDSKALKMKRVLAAPSV